MTSLETEESGHCREVVVIERFKHESMLCGEVAISEGLTEEYILFFYKNIFYKNIKAEICEILRNYILRIKPRLRI